MKDGGHDFPDGVDRCSVEIESAEGRRDVLVIGAVADRVHFGDASLTEKVIKGRIAFQLQLSRFVVRRAKQQLGWFVTNYVIFYFYFYLFSHN